MSTDIMAKITNLERELFQFRIEHWHEHDLGTIQWWLLVAVLILPWVIWWKYVDKNRLVEISLYGSMVLIISSYLDATLTDMVLWVYEYHILPVWPRLISADFTVLPVVYMLIYQYFPNWKNFFIMVTITAGIFAFVGEPFLQWAEIYKIYHWQHYYSLPIYIVIPAILKWVMTKMISKQAASP